MFEHLDNANNLKAKNAKQAEKKGINLLPEDFKYNKKNLLHDKNISSHSSHKKNKKGHLKDNSKKKKFSLAKIFSSFKFHHQKKKINTNILDDTQDKHPIPSKPAPSLTSTPPIKDTSSSTPLPKPPATAPLGNHVDSSSQSSTKTASDTPIFHTKTEKDSSQAKDPNEIAFSQIKKLNTHSDKKEDDLEVNLLPARKHKLSASQMLISYALIFIISLLAVYLPYFYFKTAAAKLASLNQSLSKQVSSITKENKGLQTQIKESSSFTLKVSHVLNFLNNHIYWSKFFPTLERNTVQNVYFTTLDVGNQNDISLRGYALDLRDLAEQIVVFKSTPAYFNIELASLSLANLEDLEGSGEPKVEFVIEFTLNNSIIHQSN